MPENITASISGGKPGVLSFAKGPNGRGLVLGSEQAAPPEHPASVAPPETPVETTPEPTTPFQKLYPGVDPAKVDFTFDEKTRKIRFVPKAEEAAEEPQDEGNEAPAIEEQATATPTNEVAELRAAITQQNQIIQGMLVAQATGKPLAEVLGLPAQPAEPDYSQYDMYDPAQAAQLMKDVVRAELQSSLQQHQPVLESARRTQEFQTIQAQFGADPAFQQKAVAAIQLVQENPSLTIPAAYGVVNKVQQSLGVNETPTKTPAQASANKAQQTTLTPEQAAAKAAQAARLPQNSGVRGGGEPPIPDNLGFKDAVRWVTHQVALGNIKA